MRYLSLLLVLLLTPFYLAAISDNAGTTGFAFFKIAYSARAAALGGAYTAQSQANDGALFNPAGLYLAQKRSLQTTYVSWLQGYNGAGINYSAPVNEKCGFAFYGQYLGADDFEKTTANSDGSWNDEGSFSSGETLVGAAAGYHYSDVLNLGASVKYLRESIDSYSASAVAFDIGVLHQTSNEKLKLALTLKNIGSQLTYFTDANNNEGLPMTASVGVNYQAGEKVLILADVNKPFAEDFDLRIGAEYSIHSMLDLRLGYTSRGSDWHAGSSGGNLSGITAGFGTHYKNLSLDYAAASYGQLGLVQQLGLVYNF